ncbi:MAG: PIG-L family deacetylase [Rhodospirillaceae bacterium]|nr:PIG-L family deacetylase [Rhodospirillaceae bacterium]
MSQVLVVAPHPDDETLGCGGTLLRHKAAGDDIHCVLVTAMTPELGFSDKKIKERAAIIESVSSHYGFDSVHSLGLPTTKLDTFPMLELAKKASEVISKVKPDTIYLPFPGDAHSDHRIVFEMFISSTKWFRNPEVKRVLSYETLSETGFNPSPTVSNFAPNTYVDISDFLDGKLQAMRLYADEMGDFPFPRSEKAIAALASLRGSESGFEAAESFMLLNERLG